MKRQVKQILKVCEERREMGKHKYGDNAYEGKDMYEEIKQELYDTINYALFQIIKINKLQEKQGTEWGGGGGYHDTTNSTSSQK